MHQLLKYLVIMQNTEVDYREKKAREKGVGENKLAKIGFIFC